MSVKLGGPKNYYQDTDAKKLGLKSAENAINKNIEDIATNAENIATNTADITAIKAKDVEQDGKISALEDNPVLPSGGTGDNGKVVTYNESGDNYILTTPAGGGGIDAEVIADEYDDSIVVIPGDTYSKHEGCYHSGRYICKFNNVTGAWNATKWQSATEKQMESWGLFLNLYEFIEINDEYWTPSGDGGVSLQNQTYTDQQLEALGLMIVSFPPYAGESTEEWGHTYSAGDYVMYDDELYICEDTTGGQWDSSKWTRINVMSQIGSAPTPTSFTPTYGYYNTVSQIGKDFENGPVYQVLVKLDSRTSAKTINVPNRLNFKRFYSIAPFIKDTSTDFYNSGYLSSLAIQVMESTTSFDVQCVGSLTDKEMYVEIIFSAFDDE